MAVRAAHWAALLGEWQFRGGAATYTGSRDPKAPVGFAVTDLLFREGTLTARITLPDPTIQARLVFGLDTERKSQFSIGLGGTVAYYLDVYTERTGGTALQAWAPPETLSTGVHAVKVAIRGQSLDFSVDDVVVFGAQLPHPLQGEQVGVLASGPGVRFDAIEAERVLPRAFAVMAFESPFDDLYAEVIVPACIHVGLEPVRADELRYPGVILQDIIGGIREATVVIAEISAVQARASNETARNEGFFNANVFYELGFAHAIEKPTILLARKETRLPFDISGYRVIFYDDTIGGKPRVDRELRSHLENILGLPVTND
jgi:hypothetical protein